MNSVRRHLRALAAWIAPVLLTGCAFGYFGPADLKQGRASVPLDLTPHQAIERFGVPDRSVQIGDRAYWQYRLHRGNHVNLLSYLSFGTGKREEAQLEFVDGKLMKVEFYPAGSTFAWGIFGNAYPGMVAE